MQASGGRAALTSTDRYTAAAATGVMAAIGTGAIVWGLKLSKPIWKPAAFAFLIEFFTHYSEDPPVKGPITVVGDKVTPAGETKVGWWLPSKLGFWTPTVTRMVNTKADYNRVSGMYQALISGIVSATIWYVVARGFFGVAHRGALWFAAIYGIIGAYSGYLMGDEKGGYRLPQGGSYVTAKTGQGGAQRSN